MDKPSRFVNRVDEEKALVTCPECDKEHVTKCNNSEEERIGQGKTLYLYCNECMSKWEDFPPIGGYAIARRQALENKK